MRDSLEIVQANYSQEYQAWYATILHMNGSLQNRKFTEIERGMVRNGLGDVKNARITIAQGLKKIKRPAPLLRERCISGSEASIALYRGSQDIIYTDHSIICISNRFLFKNNI